MLIGIRIKTLEKLRSRGSFKFNGGDESEDRIPVFFNDLSVDVSVRQDRTAFFRICLFLLK